MIIQKLSLAVALSVFHISAAKAQAVVPDPSKSITDLVLEVSTAKTGYQLGEVVNVQFQLRNPTTVAKSVRPPNVLLGNLRFWVSQDGHQYREYRGPNWGMLDARPHNIEIKSGDQFRTEATVFFNRTQPSAHLNPMYAEQIQKVRIGTDYAFVEPGGYWLKASYQFNDSMIESIPSKIQISQPTGADASLWNEMKHERALGYYLHTGDVLYFPGSTEAKNFKQRIERIKTRAQ
jgi:hypothetical protein